MSTRTGTPPVPAPARTFRIAFGVPRTGDLLVALSLLLGLLWPTSVGGTIQQELHLAQLALLAALLIGTILRRRIVSGWFLLAVALLMPALLLGFTITTSMPDRAYGGLANYLVLAVLLCTDLRGLRARRLHVRLFVVLNVVKIALGLGVVLDFAPVERLLVQFYSSAYPELVPNMMVRGRAVFTFGTHSIAAFFYFLFLVLNLKSYLVLRRRAFLFFGSMDLVLLMSLASVAGFLFLTFGVLFMLAYLGYRRPRLAGAFLVGSTVAAGAAASTDGGSAFLQRVQRAFGSDANGFAGRYLESGPLAPTIEYIFAHPWSPVGLGYSTELLFSDSGFVLHMLRGSFPLLAAVYVGFLVYLMKNVESRTSALGLFALFFMFEAGYPNLLYARTLYLVPFIVVYLNTLDSLAIRRRPLRPSHA